MPLVELIYDKDCPNVSETRAQLLRAFAKAGIAPSWKEWDRNSKESPSYARKYGSPTILIDGVDCAGVPESFENSCRVYADGSGILAKIPTLEILVSTLKSESNVGGKVSGKSWLSHAAILPGIGFACLPKLACPACWPAYAGLLTSLGLGFLLNTQYLLYLTILFLAVALGALTFGAKNRWGYRPLALGIVASTIVLIGKFRLESDPLMYVGIGLLIIASVWNTWPRRVAKTGSCPSCCVQTGP